MKPFTPWCKRHVSYTALEALMLIFFRQEPYLHFMARKTRENEIMVGRVIVHGDVVPKPWV